MIEIIKDKMFAEIGDITLSDSEAIVNAANSSLYGGGGVDGAIHRAGGPEILEECRTIRKTLYPEGLPTGKAVLTNSGNLACLYVIHTVGPIWRDGDNNEEELLANCYKSCLQIAGEKNLFSISFPAISTGVYGFPKHKADKIALKTISEWLKGREFPDKVFLYFFSQNDFDIFCGCI